MVAQVMWSLGVLEDMIILFQESMYIMYKNFAIRIKTATWEEMNDFALAEPNVLED